MCEPVSLAMFAVSAVSTIASADAQRHQANTQQDAMTRQAEQQQNALRLQMTQQGEAAAQASNERTRQANAEAASFDAISGEYGGGATAMRGEQAIAFNQYNDLGTIATNRNNALSQLGQDALGVNNQYQAGLASIQRPSQLGTALSIAGSAAGSYAGYDQKQTLIGLAQKQGGNAIISPKNTVVGP